MAENAAFSKVCYLLIYSELPNKQQAAKFCDSLTHHSMIHEDIKKFFEGNLPTVHLMAILSSMVTSLSTYYPDAAENDVDLNMVGLLAKVNTIATYAYKKSIGQPFIYPRNDLSYCGNFLHMM